MPKQSKIAPVLIPKEEWIRTKDAPIGFVEGHQYGFNCVIIRYSTDEISDGPNLHIHPYDEIFHIITGRAEFTVGEKKFVAEEGAIVIGPANIPHGYKNLGPGRLDSVDVHLSPEWIQYDLPKNGEALSASKFG